MKILLTVLTTFVLLVTMGTGYLISEMDAKDAAKVSASVEELKQSLPEGTDAASMDAFVAEKLQELDIPSPSQFGTARIFALLVALFALITLIAYFMNIPQLKIIVGIFILVAIVSLFLHPAFDKGEYGSISNDKGGMVLAAISIVGGVLAIFGQKLKNKAMEISES